MTTTKNAALFENRSVVEQVGIINKMRLDTSKRAATEIRNVRITEVLDDAGFKQSRSPGRPYIDVDPEFLIDDKNALEYARSIGITGQLPSYLSPDNWARTREEFEALTKIYEVPIA